ncbi:MAG: phospholipase A [Burkholderiales bacterium]
MGKFRLLRLLIASALIVLATEASARWLVSQVGSDASAGSIELDVVLVNDTGAPLLDALADRLRARLSLGPNAAALDLVAIGVARQPDTPIAPGAFRIRRYTMTVPAGFTGPVQLELMGTDARAIVMVAAPGITKMDPALPPAQMTGSRASDPEPPDRDLDPRPPALSTYEPMYFILGTRENATAKMQLSFKYRPFDEEIFGTGIFAPLSKLHFGYTQASLWDIGQESAPFRDTSYRPGIFYLEPDLWRSADGGRRLSFAAGLEHESNGRDGESSRSMNNAYLRPRWRVNFGRDYYWALSPKFVKYLEKSDNTDIADYRGYVDLNIRLGRYDGFEVSSVLRKGNRTAGSIQLDLTYPIRRRIFADAGGFVHLQYFNGYGESLLDYNVHRRSQMRLGFSIVR